jgi:hypothetical protein
LPLVRIRIPLIDGMRFAEFFKSATNANTSSTEAAIVFWLFIDFICLDWPAHWNGRANIPIPKTKRQPIWKAVDLYPSSSDIRLDRSARFADQK